jgi:hypothetical protein
MPSKKPCKWNGIQYESISAAARAVGVTPEAMISRLERGYTCDEEIESAINNDKRKPCVWNGVEYPSVSAAAEAVGISVGAMSARLRKGYSRDEDVRSYTKSQGKDK